MASSKFISFAITNKHTAVLTLNRPPVNALNIECLEELHDNLKKLNLDNNVKAVILTSGSSKFFVSGADIKEMSGIKTEEEGMRFSEKGQAVMDQIELATKPYIAAVDGVCLGGGLELALACHFRIAGSEAQLGLPEINLGLIPGFGGTQRLPRIVGPTRALEMMLTGKPITANEAKEIGLVNQVVQKGKALDAAFNLAEQIQSKSADSTAAILSLANNRDCVSLDEKLKKESEAFGKLFPTHNTQEGLKAFLEKRLPNFNEK